MVTIFTIDDTVPLFSVVVGKIHFFADRLHILKYVEGLDASDSEPYEPAWKRVFEADFDKSVDDAWLPRTDTTPR